MFVIITSIELLLMLHSNQCNFFTAILKLQCVNLLSRNSDKMQNIVHMAHIVEL